MLLKINLTIDTKACPCITGQFGTITIFLLFTRFSACFSQCVTYLTTSAVRICIAFLKIKHEPLNHVIFEINLTINTKACACVTGQFSTITIFLLFTRFSACVSQSVTCFSIFAVRICNAFSETKHEHPICVLLKINLTIDTKAYTFVTGQFSTITISLLLTWFSACVR